MYIVKTSCISPQKTHDGSYVQETIIHTGNKYNAIEPDYKGLIRPAQLRRMGKSIRMGIGAGLPILQELQKVDGIILASSEGGLEDCIKFLNQIEHYNEGALTPTNFVQSTPNALAGNLALMAACKAYNMTHVHRGLAFENALLDALLLFEEQKAGSILLGNVEEISEYNFNIETLAGQFKEEETNSESLFSSQTPGTVCGEGSCMFLLSNTSENALAEIKDVAQISFPSKEELINHITAFLNRNGIKPQDIDTLILGKNGDTRTDFWYTDVCDTLFEPQNQYCYKNLVGEYATAMAFGVFMACEIAADKLLPAETMIRKSGGSKHILVYNHYKGAQHGLVLIRCI
ncbi:beta-ketoacyl synthase chain length factor [Carboxylicivirga sp. RSCT41]|uniref:beta-ketoacyl synthase chain length factor n=1 Tax=Carboxylicivirga agarovorans TaxID=3417570 RepID=UPI003D335099